MEDIYRDLTPCGYYLMFSDYLFVDAREERAHGK